MTDHKTPLKFSDEKSITDENNEASFKAHSHGAVRSITLFLLF